MKRDSVFIPIAAYKTKHSHLKYAISSVLSQTWLEFEILVSDDSPDDTLRSVVEGFNDSRITYRHNDPRLGVAANYARCIDESRHNLIAVLNHDDAFEPEFLEKLITPLMNDEELSASFCDHWVIDDDSIILHALSDELSARYGRTALQAGRKSNGPELFVNQSIPAVMGTVFRKSKLGESLPINSGPAYDLWLSYLFCRNAQPVYFVKERLSSWRNHSSNLTSAGGIEWARGAADCWLTAMGDPSMKSAAAQIRFKAARALRQCGLVSWKSARRTDALKYLYRSFRLAPSVRSCAMMFLSQMPVQLVLGIRNWATRSRRPFIQ